MRESGMEDRESKPDVDKTPVSSNDEGDTQPLDELMESTTRVNGTSDASPPHNDSPDLEDGELEEGEIDDDDDEEENKEEENDADKQEPTDGSEPLLKIPPLMLNLKKIANCIPETDGEKDTGAASAEGSASESSGGDDNLALSRSQRKRRNKKKNKKRKKDDKPEKGERKKKKKSHYIDHDRVDDTYTAETAAAAWPSYSDHKSSSYNDRRAGSPQRPFDNPYNSPPGPYDSPSEDEEFSAPRRKSRRYTTGSDEESQYPRKKTSLLSMLEEEYMDVHVAANENQELFDRECTDSMTRSSNKQRKHDKAKYYKELARQRDEMKEVRSRSICKFYKESKCSKGSDCPYSHNMRVPRRQEICKFYLLQVCNKGDNCQFMHGTFPCRYYHVNGHCVHGDNCKYSHAELTDETRAILNRVVSDRDDVDPESPRKRPSLLGSPPRHLRDLKQNMGRGADASSDAPLVKKIPSLFDIQVYPPGQGPSAKLQSPSHSQGAASDAMSPRNRTANFYSESAGEALPSGGHQRPPVNGEQVASSSFSDPDQPAQAAHTIQSPDLQDDSRTAIPASTGASSTSGDDNNTSNVTDIPAHLAPKQRELFLRIQSQQRAATTESNANEERKKDAEDDNWYSSDEEEPNRPSLVANVLKTVGAIAQQSNTNCPQKTPQQQPARQLPQQQQPAHSKQPPLLPTPPMSHRPPQPQRHPILAQQRQMPRHHMRPPPPPQMMPQMHHPMQMRPPFGPFGQPPLLRQPPAGPPPRPPLNFDIAQMLNVIRQSVAASGDGNPSGSTASQQQQGPRDPRDPRTSGAAAAAPGRPIVDKIVDDAPVIDASLSQSGGVPYVLRRMNTMPAPVPPASCQPHSEHPDPRVRKFVRKLPPALIQPNDGDKTRVIPLLGPADDNLTTQAPSSRLPAQLGASLAQLVRLAAPVDNSYTEPPPTGPLTAFGLPLPGMGPPSCMPPPPATFPPRIAVPHASNPRGIDPRAFLAGGDLRGVQNARAHDPRSQDPRSQDPRSHDPRSQDPRGQDQRSQDSRAQDPRAQDPRSQDPRSQDPRSQDPRSQDPRSQDPRSQDPRPQNTKALDSRVEQKAEDVIYDNTSHEMDTSAESTMTLLKSTSTPLPSLLQKPPPALLTSRSEPKDISSEDESMTMTDQHRPLLAHRNDPRFRKRARLGLQHSSPLDADEDNSNTTSNSYNRPPNSNFQQNVDAPSRIRSEVIISQTQTRVRSPSVELSPEQVTLTGELTIDDRSLKDMFRTFDPTASPFC